MSESLREIVARAICRSDGLNPNRLRADGVKNWRPYLDNAAAALAAIEPLLQAMRRHIRSYEPGTLVGSELSVAIHLRDLDGEIWEPWCVPGSIEANADAEFKDLVQRVEASGTHVVCPVTLIEAARAVSDSGRGMRESINAAIVALDALQTLNGALTDYESAMLAARPRDE